MRGFSFKLFCERFQVVRKPKNRSKFAAIQNSRFRRNLLKKHQALKLLQFHLGIMKSMFSDRTHLILIRTSKEIQKYICVEILTLKNNIVIAHHKCAYS